MNVCPHCHGNSLDGWDICSRCKRPLPAPSPAASPAPSIPAPIPVQPIPPRGYTMQPNLIACSACGGIVSRKAQSCPHCGQPMNEGINRPPRPTIETKAGPFATFLLFGVITGWLIFQLVGLSNTGNLLSGDNNAGEKYVIGAVVSGTIFLRAWLNCFR